jgi:hypothetical protein
MFYEEPDRNRAATLSAGSRAALAAALRSRAWVANHAKESESKQVL